MLGLVQGLTRSAVGNARRAAAALEDAVLDRRDLAPAEDPADDAVPGGLSVLPSDEALALLTAHVVGRYCYVARAGVPDVVPVNYLLRDGCVLVRSGPGPKLQAAERGDWVAIEVDELDEAGRSGRSVVVAGPARVLDEHEARTLHDGPEPWATGPRRHVIAVEVRRVTGRRLG